jgi:tetratricopeptide (TPR) repeat protein
MEVELIKKALGICKIKEKEKKYEELESVSQQILKVDPENLPAKYFLALSTKKMNKKEDYSKILQEITSLKFNKSKRNTVIGSMLCDLEEFDHALTFHKKAVKLNPKNFDAWSKLGNHYRLMRKYYKSIKCLKKSYFLNKNNEEVLVNLSASYMSIKKIDKSISKLKKAIKINKKCYSAKFNLGCSFLLKNNFEKGWKYYRYRFENFSYFENLPKEKNLLGKKITNKKILFFAEQGIGDIINFVRFINLFKEKYPNCEVKLSIDKNYTSSFIDFIKQNYKELLEENEEFNYDYWCSIMDIPQYLNLNSQEIKKSYAPYLKANKKCDYSYFDGMYKIGVCWAGNAGHPRDDERSCQLSLFREIYKIPNVKLFSLQKDLRLRIWPCKKDPIDLSDCSDIRLINMRDHMNSWEDTAAIIQGLDLVISVDTSILHLAGALGKPTCALMQYAPDWRWALESNKTIWYPNMTLFRQKKLGDWDSVFEELLPFVKNCALKPSIQCV